MTHYLDLRHFRSGDVRALIVRKAWHQNGAHGGAGMSYTDANAVLDCTTAEDVVVALKALSDDHEQAVYGYGSDVEESLAKWGIPASLPAPDEVTG